MKAVVITKYFHIVDAIVIAFCTAIVALITIQLVLKNKPNIYFNHMDSPHVSQLPCRTVFECTTSEQMLIVMAGS